MRLRPTCFAALPLALLACGGSPAPAPATPTAPAPPPELAFAPTASVVPAPPAGPVTSNKLSVFAEGWGLFATTVGGKAVLYDRYFGGWADVEGDAAKLAPSAFDGVTHGEDHRITMLTHVSTAATAMTVALPGSRLALYRRAGAGWGSLGAIPFSGYSSIFFTQGPGDELEAVMTGLGSASTVPVTGKELPKLELKSDKARALPADLEPIAMHGLPSGDLFVAGARRVGPGAPPNVAHAVVAHFAPGAATATLDELPEAFPSKRPERVAVRICGRVNGPVYVIRDAWIEEHVSKAYVVGWRDGAWKVVSGPSDDTTGVNLVSCAVTPDGALWTAFTSVPNSQGQASRVFRMAPDGAWSTVPLPTLAPLAERPKLTPAKGKPGQWDVGSAPLSGPTGLTLGSLDATTAGEIFINATRTAGGRPVAIDDAPFNEPRSVILRTGEPPAGGVIAWDKLAGDVVAHLARKAAPSTPAAAPGKPMPAAKPAPAAPPEPAHKLVAATPSCTSVFVALYAVAPSTPADYDFPRTHDALAARPALATAGFVEADLGGKRTFGAMVPSYAFGKDLVDLIQAKVEGSKPQLLCGEPLILRSVPMELSTKAVARARSAVPTLVEWNGVGEVTVEGSSALGCETKRVREWVRVTCRGKSKAGATPKSVTVDRGAASSEVFTFASGGVVSLVYPFAEGSDFAATFTFSDGPHLLASAWPAGAPQPTVVGEMK